MLVSLYEAAKARKEELTRLLLERKKVEMQIGNSRVEKGPVPKSGPPNKKGDDDGLKKRLDFANVPEGPVFTPPRHPAKSPPPPPPATPPREVAANVEEPKAADPVPVVVPPVDPHRDPFQERCPSWISGVDHDEDTEAEKEKSLPENRPVAAPLRGRDSQDDASPVSRLNSMIFSMQISSAVSRGKGSPF